MRVDGGGGMVKYRLLLFLGLLGALAGAHIRRLDAQSPVPTHFLKACEPNGQCSDEGQAGVVIYGLSLGLGNPPRPHTMDDTVFYTAARIQAHLPVITEVSPQSYVDGSVQDWESAILTLIERVEASASPSDVGTYWGGVMIDDEQSFWTAHPDESSIVADLAAITNYTVDQMTGAPCCSFVYSQLFLNAASKTSTTCYWSLASFNSIIGMAIPAPQVATECMAAYTNDHQALTGQDIFATWSLGPDYWWLNFVRASGVINGPPGFDFGYSLSICYANGSPCDDWDGDGIPNSIDGDSDGDECADIDEPQFGLNVLDPWDFYSVPVPALFAAPNPVGLQADNTVSASDAQAVFAYFKAGARAGTQDYDQDLNRNGVPDGWEYDRSYLGSAQSGPPDGVVSAQDAQIADGQFHLNYHC
jgi:hypothetical protein